MSKIKKAFTSAKQLDVMINQYFTGSQSETKKIPDTAEAKTESFQAGPPTLAGLALHLGFNTRKDFETLETKGIYAARLQRARLQIEALFERNLHRSSSGSSGRDGAPTANRSSRRLTSDPPSLFPGTC